MTRNDMRRLFLDMAKNHDDYGTWQLEFSTRSYMRYIEENDLLEPSGNDFADEFKVGQVFQDFENFHEIMKGDDNSPTGPKAQELIRIGRRRPENEFNVGES